MRRRISDSVSTSGGRGPRDAADAPERAPGWADDRVPTWGAGDEERVARWLSARRGMPVPGSGGSAGSAPVRRADPWEAPVGLSALAGATVPAATPISPPAGAGPAAAGGGLTTRPEAAAAAPVAPVPGVAGPRAALVLQVARDEADALEARRLEEWITLDEEVAALTARRRRLRRLRHRCRGRAS